MALRVGDGAPRAEALAPWAGRPVVLFFYPADETPGCVAEACGYRDLWGEFAALGVAVVGVSRDDEASHAAFAARRRLPFPLVADRDGALHKAFGALLFGTLPRRISFLVAADGRVAAVFASGLRPAEHPARMLAAARALLGA